MEDLETRAAAPDRYERLFVYGIFVLLAAGLFYYVWKFSRNVPLLDDWELMPALVGREPMDLGWFFFEHNEHRYPVTRLVVVLVWKVTGDLRVVMALTSLLLSVLALSMIRTVRALRGSTSYTDAFFPLVLLGWGHFENLISTIQLFFVAPVVMCCLILLVALSDRWRGRPTVIAGIGALLVLIPLHGAVGIALAMPTVIWAGLAGLARWRDGTASGRRDARVLAACAAVAAVECLALLATLRPKPWHPPSPGPLATSRTALEILSLAIGPDLERLWVAAGVGVLATFVCGLGLALSAAYRRGDDRLRALAIVLAFGAFGGLVLAVAHSRAGLGADQGLADRYAIFSAPILCIAYLAFELYMPRDSKRFLQICLFTCLCVAFPTSYFAAKVYGYDKAERADALARDVGRGFPSTALARRHVGRVFPDETTLARRLEILREEGVSIFASAPKPPAPCLRREEVSPEVVGSNDVELVDGRWRATGGDPFLVLDLESARYVCAVEVTFTLASPAGRPATLEAFWMQTGATDFAPGLRSEAVPLRTSSSEQTVTFWINETIDRFRLDPDAAPAEFRVVRIALVEPALP